MSMAVVGMIAGMALGFAGYFGGFGAFLLVAALGAVGFVAGRFLEGDLEPGDFFRSRDARRPAAVTRREPTGATGQRTPRPRPAGERGATRIADRVVAKIAAQAAREALAGVPPGRRAAARHRHGAPRHRPGPGQPRARLSLRHRRAVRGGAPPCRRAGRAHWRAWRCRRWPSRSSGCTRGRAARHRGGSR